MASVWKKFSSYSKVEKPTVVTLCGAANNSLSPGVVPHPSLGGGMPTAGVHLVLQHPR